MENRVLEGLSDTFSIIYDQLNSNQRSLLYVISLRESQRLYAEDTRKRFDLPSKSIIKTSIDGLIQRSIILKDNNKYRFENPIVKLWIQKIFKA